MGKTRSGLISVIPPGQSGAGNKPPYWTLERPGSGTGVSCFGSVSFVGNLQNGRFSVFLIGDVANIQVVAIRCKSAERSGLHGLGVRRGESGLRRATGVGTRPRSHSIRRAPTCPACCARIISITTSTAKSVFAGTARCGPRRTAVPRGIFSSRLSVSGAGSYA